MTTLTPTSGAQWRSVRREGVAVTLPSGYVAKLRPVALDIMITSGELPDLLTPLAAKTLYGEIENDELSSAADLATNMAKLLSVVCKASFVSPKIVDDPQADDEISLEDVDFGDKMIVFNLAIAGAEALRSFRRRQTANVEPLSYGEGDAQPTE